MPQKNDEYSHWEPIFYVCSSARNWVSFMYKVYILYMLYNIYIYILWIMTKCDLF